MGTKFLWWIVLTMFMGASLFPIWSTRCPPMQDYPRHLALAEILNRIHDPAFDYGQNFDDHLRVGPYSFFYLAVLGMAAFFPVETAGKVVISLYLVLIAFLVGRISLRSSLDPPRSPSFPSWTPLLFFLFAFNQFYFLGMVNFIISVPLLILALRDHDRLSREDAGRHPFVRHILWQIVLFLAHPFTFLIYIFFALLGAAVFDRARPKFKRSLILPFAAAVVFSTWYVMTTTVLSTSAPAASSLRWLPPRMTIAYLAYMFTGMRWFDGVDMPAVVLWTALGVVILRGYLVLPKKERSLPDRYVLFLGVSLLALLTLPFAQGGYSYVNLRFAPVSYFFLTMIVSNLRWKRGRTAVLIFLIASLMASSVVKQRRISREIGEVVPLIKVIPPNVRILPLVFDNDSPELDRPFFDVHLHDHDYYHVFVGGGINPYFPRESIFPVRYKAHAEKPAPPEYQPQRFVWDLHADDYRYFLARRAPPEFVSFLSTRAEPVGRSGPWILFKKK